MKNELTKRNGTSVMLYISLISIYMTKFCFIINNYLILCFDMKTLNRIINQIPYAGFQCTLCKLNTCTESVKLLNNKLCNK